MRVTLRFCIGEKKKELSAGPRRAPHPLCSGNARLFDLHVTLTRCWLIPQRTGICVNRVIVSPGTKQPLRHGDEITMGTLRCGVLLEDERICDEVGASCKLCSRQDGDVRTLAHWLRRSIASTRAWPLCRDCWEETLKLNSPQSHPNYWVVQILGSGSMGTVYKALALAGKSNRDGFAALKELLLSSDETQALLVGRFERESDILSKLHQLRHRGIVSFYGYEKVEAYENVMIVMEYVAGINAEEWLSRNRHRRSVRTSIQIVDQVLEALEAAHKLGIIHRDIKPKNLLVVETPRHPMIVKVIDFGLAYIKDDNQLGSSGTTAGTLGFMAPEQFTSLADARKPAVDQYSAAATLYYLLTEKDPHDLSGKSAEECVRIRTTQDPMPIQVRRPKIDRGLAKIIHTALARDPSARYHGLRDLRRALRPFAE